MTQKLSIEEQFTVDHGVGKGYTVYYRRKNGCYCYTVTTDNNGSLLYSKTHRVTIEEFDRLKEENS